MPATTPGIGKGKAEQNSNRARFVKCNLSDEQRAALRYWREHDAELSTLSEWLNSKIADGHTFSIKGQEVGYMATMTGVRATSGHMDLCLASRAATPMGAAFALQYMDEEVLKGTWIPSERELDLDL